MGVKEQWFTRVLPTSVQAVGTSGKVIGVDISEEMLKISSDRARESAVEDRLELHCCDAVRLDLEVGCGIA